VCINHPCARVMLIFSLSVQFYPISLVMMKQEWMDGWMDGGRVDGRTLNWTTIGWMDLILW